jgi:hypothetical protein
MNTPTYKEQFDKITSAYIKGEIEPMSPSFCFCGTLAENKDWCVLEPFTNKHGYSSFEYKHMEDALLTELMPLGVERCIGWGTPTPGRWTGYPNTDDPTYEDRLFAGMCKALDVLKEIHEFRGEIVDPIPFKKRELVKA